MSKEHIFDTQTNSTEKSTYTYSSTKAVSVILHTTGTKSALVATKPQKNEVTYLWEKINLLGCITVLQEMYEKSLIRGKGFLAIEIGICAIILIEIAALAFAFAYSMNTNNVDYETTNQNDEDID